MSSHQFVHGDVVRPTQEAINRRLLGDRVGYVVGPGRGAMTKDCYHIRWENDREDDCVHPVYLRLVPSTELLGPIKKR
jgi:hypothetical protein